MTPDEINAAIETAVEAAVAHAFRAYASDKFAMQELRMNAMETKIDENSAATSRVETSTPGIVTMMHDWDGAMKVIDKIGSALKPVTYIIGFCSAIVALWYGIKKGG
jgi:hypothetical protein